MTTHLSSDLVLQPRPERHETWDHTAQTLESQTGCAFLSLASFTKRIIHVRLIPGTVCVPVTAESAFRRKTSQLVRPLQAEGEFSASQFAAVTKEASRFSGYPSSQAGSSRQNCQLTWGTEA